MRIHELERLRDMLLKDSLNRAEREYVRVIIDQEIMRQKKQIAYMKIWQRNKRDESK